MIIELGRVSKVTHGVYPGVYELSPYHVGYQDPK
jgi:hypothetical protein